MTGSTRRGAIAATAAGALAFAPRAIAADPDAARLAALATYQAEVVAAYDAVLSKANGAERATLQRLRRRAAQAGAALPRAPAVPPAPADTTVQMLIAAEEALIASYYAALQDLSDERHLEGVAAFMADAGRRVVVLRELAHEPLLPRAFETGGA